MGTTKLSYSGFVQVGVRVPWLEKKDCSSSWVKIHGVKISGHQQRWPRPLPGAILIPPALLGVADSNNQNGNPD